MAETDTVTKPPRPHLSMEQLNGQTCASFRAVRSAVMKRAWERMDKEGMPLGEAISTSWKEAKSRCKGTKARRQD